MTVSAGAHWRHLILQADFQSSGHMIAPAASLPMAIAPDGGLMLPTATLPTKFSRYGHQLAYCAAASLKLMALPRSRECRATASFRIPR
ncbi:MAG: hypothetical protein AAGA01_06545 [Cyanobacteria bacterium P01_E01_bin.43]